jgi:hypothetical protein
MKSLAGALALAAQRRPAPGREPATGSWQAMVIQTCRLASALHDDICLAQAPRAAQAAVAAWLHARRRADILGCELMVLCHAAPGDGERDLALRALGSLGALSDSMAAARWRGPVSTQHADRIRNHHLEFQLSLCELRAPGGTRP